MESNLLFSIFIFQDNYFQCLEAEYPNDFEQRRNTLDVHVLYKSGGGMPHGRVPIANGAVKKATMKATARAQNVRPSKSMSYNQLLARNAQLEQGSHHSSVLCKHLRVLTFIIFLNKFHYYLKLMTLTF